VHPVKVLTAAFTLSSAAVAAANTESYACRFATEASPTGVTKPASPLELRFVHDIAAEKAYLMGNAGSSQVGVIDNKNGISFLEITAAGNVMTTTITTQGEAVHSRNGIMMNKLIPSQYYGRCSKQ
jgi:phage gp36-like protein